MRATFVASRPSTWSVAPTFSASASSPFATYVRIAPSHTFPLETNFNPRVWFPPCQSRASSRTVYSHRFPLVLLACKIQVRERNKSGSWQEEADRLEKPLHRRGRDWC